MFLIKSRYCDIILESIPHGNFERIHKYNLKQKKVKKSLKFFLQKFLKVLPNEFLEVPISQEIPEDQMLKGVPGECRESIPGKIL